MYNVVNSFLWQIRSRHEVFPRLINDMLQDPELLRVDVECVPLQMQEIAVGHYTAVPSASDEFQDITHEISAVDEVLTTLVRRNFS